MTPFTILHTECSTGWGGQEIRIFTEMKAMRARGHNMLLASPSRTTIYQRCKEAGFPVFDFNDAKWVYPWTIARLTSFLRREKVDVVNTHSSRDGWIGGLAARLAGVPLLIRSRHIDVSYPNVRMSRLAFYYLPHAVFTTSEQISSHLVETLRLDKKNVHCVPTGIDVDFYHPDVTSTLRTELSLPTTTPLVGVVAVLRSWKGHPFFLEAARLILQQRPDVRFVLAGNGPTRAALEQKIADLNLQEAVYMLGHQEDVPNILAGLDVVVLPSYAHEGIPQILLQAMSMNRPVVGTSVGGIPEIVQHEKTGLIVPPKDPQALASAILRLLDNRDLANSLSSQGREFILANYSISKLCEKLEALYSSYNIF